MYFESLQFNKFDYTILEQNFYITRVTTLISRIEQSTLNRGIKGTHTNYSTFHTI